MAAYGGAGAGVGDDQGSVNMRDEGGSHAVSPALPELVAGMEKVARRVEGLLPQVAATGLAAVKAAERAPLLSVGAVPLAKAPGAASILAVRESTTKPPTKLPTPVEPTHFWQPFVSVGVARRSSTSQPPPVPTAGTVMIDTGAAVTLVSKAWAEAHGLEVLPKKDLDTIAGASGTDIPIVGTCSFLLRLGKSLELELYDVAVSLAKFYQALLGTDVIGGK